MATVTATHTLPKDHPIYRETSPQRVRAMIRSGEWDFYTKGLVMGYAQANLVILPKEDALEFLVFCQRNPKPCPVIEVTDVGNPEPVYCAPGADLRTDLPRYRVFRRGELVDEPTDVKKYWRGDLVAFLIGCSLTFEGALLDAGVPIRALEENVGTCDFISSIRCRPSGKFHGPMVVSMRPMTPEQAVRATQVTTRFSATHGAPVHIGDPAAIGIEDIYSPDFGAGVTIKEGEVPVFWACGITPQVVALESKPEFMITHKPGHMFITDLRDAQVAVL
jgi:uncharacterized protein YcsI (UPF0317 family)